jgi:hypothetical protein
MIELFCGFVSQEKIFINKWFHILFWDYKIL